MLNTITVRAVAGLAEPAELHANAAAKKAASPILPFRAVEETAAENRLDTKNRTIEDSIAQVTAAQVTTAEVSKLLCATAGAV